jgi:hypothetical protein
VQLISTSHASQRMPTSCMPHTIKFVSRQVPTKCYGAVDALARVITPVPLVLGGCLLYVLLFWLARC